MKEYFSGTIIIPTPESTNKQLDELLRIDPAEKQQLFDDASTLSSGEKNKRGDIHAYSVMNSCSRRYLFARDDLYYSDIHDNKPLVRGKLALGEDGEIYFIKIITVNNGDLTAQFQQDIQHEMDMTYKYGQAPSKEVIRRSNDKSTKFYLIQKYADLHAVAFLEANSLSALEIIDLSIQVMLRVIEIYEKGDVHRDIKLPNLTIKRLPNRKLVVSVIDYDTVKPLNFEGYYDDENLVTTRKYMPPAYIVREHEDLEEKFYRYGALTDCYAAALSGIEVLNAILPEQESRLSEEENKLYISVEKSLEETLDHIEKSFTGQQRHPQLTHEYVSALKGSLNETSRLVNAVLDGETSQPLTSSLCLQAPTHVALDEENFILYEMEKRALVYHCFFIANTIQGGVRKAEKNLTLRDQIHVDKKTIKKLAENFDYRLLLDKCSKNFPSEVAKIEIKAIKNSVSILKDLRVSVEKSFSRIKNRYHLMLLKKRLETFTASERSLFEDMICEISQQLQKPMDEPLIEALQYLQDACEILEQAKLAQVKEGFYAWNEGAHITIERFLAPTTLSIAANIIADVYRYGKPRNIREAEELYYRFSESPSLLSSHAGSSQAIQAGVIEILFKIYSTDPVLKNYINNAPVGGFSFLFMPVEVLDIKFSDFSRQTGEKTKSIFITQKIFNRHVVSQLLKNFFSGSMFFVSFIERLKKRCEEYDISYQSFIFSFFNSRDIDECKIVQCEEALKIIVIKILYKYMRSLFTIRNISPEESLAITFLWENFEKFINEILRNIEESPLSETAEEILSDNLRRLDHIIYSGKTFGDYSLQDEIKAYEDVSRHFGVVFSHRKKSALAIAEVFPSVKHESLASGIDLDALNNEDSDGIFNYSLIMNCSLSLLRKMTLSKTGDEEKIVDASAKEIFDLSERLPTKLKEKLYDEPTFIRLILQYRFKKNEGLHKYSDYKTNKLAKKMSKQKFIEYFLENMTDKGAIVSMPLMWRAYYSICNLQKSDPIARAKVNTWLREIIFHSTAIFRGSVTAGMLLRLPANLLENLISGTDLTVDEIWLKAYPHKFYTANQRNSLRYSMLRQDMGVTKTLSSSSQHASIYRTTSSQHKTKQPECAHTEKHDFYMANQLRGAVTLPAPFVLAKAAGAIAYLYRNYLCSEDAKMLRLSQKLFIDLGQLDSHRQFVEFFSEGVNAKEATDLYLCFIQNRLTFAAVEDADYRTKWNEVTQSELIESILVPTDFPSISRICDGLSGLDWVLIPNTLLTILDDLPGFAQRLGHKTNSIYITQQKANLQFVEYLKEYFFDSPAFFNGFFKKLRLSFDNDASYLKFLCGYFETNFNDTNMDDQIYRHEEVIKMSVAASVLHQPVPIVSGNNLVRIFLWNGFSQQYRLRFLIDPLHACLENPLVPAKSAEDVLIEVMQILNETIAQGKVAEDYYQHEQKQYDSLEALVEVMSSRSQSISVSTIQKAFPSFTEIPAMTANVRIIPEQIYEHFVIHVHNNEYDQLDPESGESGFFYDPDTTEQAAVNWFSQIQGKPWSETDYHDLVHYWIHPEECWQAYGRMSFLLSIRSDYLGARKAWEDRAPFISWRRSHYYNQNYFQMYSQTWWQGRYLSGAAIQGTTADEFWYLGVDHIYVRMLTKTLNYLVTQRIPKNNCNAKEILLLVTALVHTPTDKFNKWNCLFIEAANQIRLRSTPASQSTQQLYEHLPENERPWTKENREILCRQVPALLHDLILTANHARELVARQERSISLLKEHENNLRKTDCIIEDIFRVIAHHKRKKIFETYCHYLLSVASVEPQEAQFLLDNFNICTFLGITDEQKQRFFCHIDNVLAKQINVKIDVLMEEYAKLTSPASHMTIFKNTHCKLDQCLALRKKITEVENDYSQFKSNQYIGQAVKQCFKRLSKLLKEATQQCHKSKPYAAKSSVCNQI